MTLLLFGLGFTLIFAPALEVLWDPLWSRLLPPSRDPSIRLRRLALRMGSGLLLAAAAAACVLNRIYFAPRTHPGLPDIVVTCLGHDLEHGPGAFTLIVLLAGSLALAGVVFALFHPLPAFPPGVRRIDLESIPAVREVGAWVESLPGDEPAAWSETVPVPRILLLGGIEDALRPQELAAVLAHEAAHLSASDHRCMMWARAYRRLLFFWPGARILFRSVVHELERRADDRVVAGHRARASDLLAALRRLATGVACGDATEPLLPAEPFEPGSDPWSLHQRCARLQGEPEADLPLLPRHPAPLLGLVAVLLVAGTEPGACILHCLIDSMP